MPGAYDFLTLLFAPYRPLSCCATLEIRTFLPKRLGGRPGPRDWFPVSDEGVGAASRWATGQPAPYEVYMGILPRVDGQGDAAGIRLAAYLWADIDGGDADLETVGEFVTGAIKEGVPHPTLMVRSGGGYHCYWRLQSPVPVREPLHQRAFHDILARLYRWFNGPAPVGVWNRDGWQERKALGRPYACPNVKDVARILRVPGTQNYKEETPRPVELVWFKPDAPVYPLVWWRANLPALPTPPDRRPMTRDRGRDWKEGKKLDYFWRLADTPSPDGDHHRAMVRLANFAFDAGLDAATVYALVERHGSVSGAQCARSPGHIENIVRWAENHRQNAR